MGYYVGIQCKSPKMRDTLQVFLRAHFQPAQVLFPWLDPNGHRMLPPEQGRVVCSYVKGACDVGWWKNAGWSHEERIYAQSFLRWMAIRAGKRALFHTNSIPGVSLTGSDPNQVSLPYTTYETMKTPVVILSQNPAMSADWSEGFEVCDDIGWASATRPCNGVDPLSHIGQIRARSAQADPLIRAELLRLDGLWGAP